MKSNIHCYNSTVEVTHSRMKRWRRRVIRRRIHKEIETQEKNPWFYEVSKGKKQEQRGRRRRRRNDHVMNRGTRTLIYKETKKERYPLGLWHIVGSWSSIFHRLQTCILFYDFSWNIFWTVKICSAQISILIPTDDDMGATNVIATTFESNSDCYYQGNVSEEKKKKR